MTRALPVAVKVSRHPLLERHGALHVGRLVLNVSKYLICLPNTRGKDHQRVRAREGESGFACCADDRPIGGRGSKEVANGLPGRRKAFECHCCVRGRAATCLDWRAPFYVWPHDTLSPSSRTHHTNQRKLLK